jgi:hypothetical protein
MQKKLQQLKPKYITYQYQQGARCKFQTAGNQSADAVIGLSLTTE